MVRAHVGTALIAVLAATVGTFVVLRGMAFIGDAIAHASFGGLAVAAVSGFGLETGALLFGVGTAVAVSWLRHHVGVRNDTALAIFYTGAFATGILLLSWAPDVRSDLLNLLLGSVLAITPQDLWTLTAVTIVATAVLWFGFERFAYVAFDPAGARAAGLPVLLTDVAFLTLTALSVVVSLRAVGVILVVALLITPAATAQLLTRRLERIIPTAAAFALSATQVGLYVSYYTATPAGASIVVIATAQFLVVWAAKALGRRWRTRS